MRQQEKMIQDMEKSVVRREVIITRWECSYLVLCLTLRISVIHLGWTGWYSTNWQGLLNLPFYIGNFASVSSYIIVTGNLPFTIAMSQWILPSTGSLPIEETTNQNKSLKIKSNLVFGEREKPEYTGKNHSVESIEPTNPTIYGVEAGIEPSTLSWKASSLTTSPITPHRANRSSQSSCLTLIPHQTAVYFSPFSLTRFCAVTRVGWDGDSERLGKVLSC